MARGGGGRGRHRRTTDDGQGTNDNGGRRTVVRYGYLTPDRFKVSVAPSTDPDRPVDLILERRGLVSWRLEGIELPK